METSYNKNKAKKFYQEMKTTRKGFKPQTLPIRHKKGKIVRNKQKVL